MLAQFGQLLRAIASGPDPARIPKPMEVIPTIELANCPADWNWPQDIYQYSGRTKENSLAANYSLAALLNPAGSNTLVVLEGFNAKTDADAVRIRCAVAADVATYDTDSAGYPRDPRTYRTLVTPQPHRSPSGIILSEQSASMHGQASKYVYPLGWDTTMYWFQCETPYMLFPGTALVFHPAALDSELSISLDWREREYSKEEVRGTPFV